MLRLADLQLVGDEVAMRWQDGAESYLPMEFLRAASPSAENMGEPDILGRVSGADTRTRVPGVRVTGWQFVGNYAVQFLFSDYHQSGLYSYAYLRTLTQRLEADPAYWPK